MDQSGRPDEGDKAALANVMMLSAWAMASVRNAAGQDPASDEARRWNECATSADQTLDLLCEAVAPGVTEVPILLKRGIHGTRSEVEAHVSFVLERFGPGSD